MTDSENMPQDGPHGLFERGSALWFATVNAFDLTPVEAELLAEACRLLDLLDGLQQVVDRDGLVMRWGDGTRVNPAVIEARATRLALVRLVAALNLPADLDEATPAGVVRELKAAVR